VWSGTKLLVLQIAKAIICSRDTSHGMWAWFPAVVWLLDFVARRVRQLRLIHAYLVSLLVICGASRFVSCSQHLVVLVSENAGTALAWSSNGRCPRLGYSGSSLESVGFTAT